MSHVLRKLALLALIISAMGVSANANMVSYNSSTGITSQLTEVNSALTFQQFNTSLGTLTGIEITVTSNLSTTITVSNTGVTTSTGRAQIDETITLLDPKGNFGGGSGYSMEALLPVTPFTFSLSAGASATSGLLSGNITVDSGAITDSANLAEFTGNSSVAINYSTQTFNALRSNGGNTNETNVTRDGVQAQNATITYTYTPNAVPEPASLAMVVLGLGGVFAARRIRRRTV